jgi:hypothetical protein
VVAIASLDCRLQSSTHSKFFMDPAQELTAEQIADLQQKAIENEELRKRLEAVDQKKAEILDEKKKLQGDTQTLVSDLEKRLEEQAKKNEELAKAVEKERSEREQERKVQEEESEAERLYRMEMEIAAVFNDSEVHQPTHVLQLIKQKARTENRKTVAEYQGEVISLSELRELLRRDEEYSYMFKPRSVGGMGARPATGLPDGPADASANPWITGNVTRQIEMRLKNPGLAARLEAEAKNASRGK